MERIMLTTESHLPFSSSCLPEHCAQVCICVCVCGGGTLVVRVIVNIYIYTQRDVYWSGLG